MEMHMCNTMILAYIYIWFCAPFKTITISQVKGKPYIYTNWVRLLKPKPKQHQPSSPPPPPNPMWIWPLRRWQRASSHEGELNPDSLSTSGNREVGWCQGISFCVWITKSVSLFFFLHISLSKNFFSFHFTPCRVLSFRLAQKEAGSQKEMGKKEFV
jgi:hypothetical protein